MAIVGDTGQGATFTLSTQTAVSAYKVIDIDIGEMSRGMIEVSHLGTTTDEERIIEDLNKHGDWIVRVRHDAYSTAVTITGSVDTATITFPASPTQTTTTGANIAASGYITAVKLPKLAKNEPQEAVYKFSPNGDTGPTYTRGS